MLSLSAFLLSDINLQVSMASVIFPTVLNGVAISFIFVPLTTATMSQLRQRQIGSATGLYNLMLNIGGSIGIATCHHHDCPRLTSASGADGRTLTPTDPAFARQLPATHPLLARHSDPVTATHQAYAFIYASSTSRRISGRLWTPSGCSD